MKSKCRHHQTKDHDDTAERWGSFCAIRSSHGHVVLAFLDAQDAATPMWTSRQKVFGDMSASGPWRTLYPLMSALTPEQIRTLSL